MVYMISFILEIFQASRQTLRWVSSAAKTRYPASNVHNPNNTQRETKAADKKRRNGVVSYYAVKIPNFK